MINTLGFEGLREGVDDVRYAATLIRVAQRARRDPAKRQKAVEADKWIRSVATQGDLDKLRRQIVDRILELSSSE